MPSASPCLGTTNSAGVSFGLFWRVEFVSLQKRPFLSFLSFNSSALWFFVFTMVAGPVCGFKKQRISCALARCSCLIGCVCNQSGAAVSDKLSTGLCEAQTFQGTQKRLDSETNAIDDLFPSLCSNAFGAPLYYSPLQPESRYVKFSSGELWLKREGGDNFWVPAPRLR